MLKRLFYLLSVIGLSVAPAAAQPKLGALSDQNGDGVVRIVAFGDSITAGVGDGGSNGDQLAPATSSSGFPDRLERLIGLPVDNLGLPGEEIATSGVERILGVLTASAPDYLVITEGTNDAVKQLGSEQYRDALQRIINVARAQGAQVVLQTLPPPCCEHSSLTLFTESYSNLIAELGLVNSLAVSDVEHAWITTCSSLLSCDLYNLPEGLHPNSRGYDVIAQTLAATMVGVDIFAASGAKDLENTLGLEAGSVIVRPGVE